MKAETARLLRSVLRLVERDVTELADAVIQIDEREAAHNKLIRERLDLIDAKLAEHVTTYDRFAHPSHPVPEGFSVKAT